MTKPLKQTSTETLVEGMADFFDIVEYEDIMSFALNRIDLSDDVSAPHAHLEFDSYPYLVEPIKACAIEDGVRKEVVIAMSEQMGKTTAEICAHGLQPVTGHYPLSVFRTGGGDFFHKIPATD